MKIRRLCTIFVCSIGIMVSVITDARGINIINCLTTVVVSTTATLRMQVNQYYGELSRRKEEKKLLMKAITDLIAQLENEISKSQSQFLQKKNCIEHKFVATSSDNQKLTDEVNQSLDVYVSGNASYDSGENNKIIQEKTKEVKIMLGEIVDLKTAKRRISIKKSSRTFALSVLNLMVKCLLPEEWKEKWHNVCRCNSLEYLRFFIFENIH